MNILLFDCLLICFVFFVLFYSLLFKYVYVGTQMYRSVYICEYVWIYTRLVKSILVRTLLFYVCTAVSECIGEVKRSNMCQDV